MKREKGKERERARMRKMTVDKRLRKGEPGKREKKKTKVFVVLCHSWVFGDPSVTMSLCHPRRGHRDVDVPAPAGLPPGHCRRRAALQEQEAGGCAPQGAILQPPLRGQHVSLGERFHRAGGGPLVHFFFGDADPCARVVFLLFVFPW